MNYSTIKSVYLFFFVFLLMVSLGVNTYGKEADTFYLTDEPGNWFRSESLGAPLSIIEPGDEIDFRINDCCTNTRHTITLIIKPTASKMEFFTDDTDQDKAGKGKESMEFDAPGVYVLLCKVHPYMTCVVAVKDKKGNIPDVTPDALPFILHLTNALGLPADTTLPATTVLSVLTTVAPSNDDAALLGKNSPTPIFPDGHPLVGANGAFGPKWDILPSEATVKPETPGVGEVWIDTQFESVPNQTDENGVPKPGTITVLDAKTFNIEREINGLGAEDNMWNNPHNIWSNSSLDTMYNSNWFGKWINKIDRASGEIVHSIEVGEAPTHIISIPETLGSEGGILTVPLSAGEDIVKVEDDGDLKIIDKIETGEGENNPHGHWLNCGIGDRIVAPNVFHGLGPFGSISVMDTLSGEILAEFFPGSDEDSNMVMPIAAGECHVDVDGTEINKAYITDVVTGSVNVLDVGSAPDFRTPDIITNIPVTIRPNGVVGGSVFDTLQVPIQTPVTPDGKFVATAVLSLTTVPRPLPITPAGQVQESSADHVAIIDARTDTVVKWLPTPAGTHGINWGAKKGGGYYAYVANQHSNAMTVIDPDPDGNGDGKDAAVVGTIVLANNSAGAGITDGTGGQGIKPIPVVHDGWVQPTASLVAQDEKNGNLGDRGLVSGEVEGWIKCLTEDQLNPDLDHHHQD